MERARNLGQENGARRARGAGAQAVRGVRGKRPEKCHLLFGYLQAPKLTALLNDASICPLESVHLDALGIR